MYEHDDMKTAIVKQCKKYIGNILNYDRDREIVVGTFYLNCYHLESKDEYN